MGKVETVAEKFYIHKVNKILAKILNSLKHHLDTPNFNYYSSHLLSLGCLCRGQDTAIMKLANFTFSKHTQTHTQLLVNFSTQNNSKSVKINEQQFNKIHIPYIIEKQDESISLRQKRPWNIASSSQSRATRSIPSSLRQLFLDWYLDNYWDSCNHQDQLKTSPAISLPYGIDGFTTSCLS